MNPADDYARALADARQREVSAHRDIERLVLEARMLDVPWSVIGTALGITKQGAQKRYGAPQTSR